MAVITLKPIGQWNEDGFLRYSEDLSVGNAWMGLVNDDATYCYRGRYQGGFSGQLGTVCIGMDAAVSPRVSEILNITYRYRFHGIKPDPDYVIFLQTWHIGKTEDVIYLSDGETRTLEYSFNVHPNTGNPLTVDDANDYDQMKMYVSSANAEMRCHKMWKVVTYTPVIIMGVTNLAATGIGNHKATLWGDIEDNGGECTERGFIYKEGIDGGEHPVSEQGDFPNGNYSYQPTAILKANTLYYFKAWAKNSIGTVYADNWEPFTTTNIIPTVTTQVATDITSVSVTGNGTIVAIGGLEDYCIGKGFDVEYEFSGSVEEYNAWQGHGFIGDVVYNAATDKWEGTLVKEYSEEGEYSIGAFALSLDDLINNKTYKYRAKAKNSIDWGFGDYIGFTTDTFLTRKSCTCGVFTILLCAVVESIPLGSVIKRRGFRWGKYTSAQEFDIHEDGDFSASAIIGPANTISLVNSADDNVYDTIVDSAKGFVTAGFVADRFIDVSATGAINPVNEGQFKIISVSGDGGTITVNVRNTLVSETPTGVTIVDLYALYIVDLTPETSYYSVAYVAIEDSEGNWTVQEGSVAMGITLVNPFEIEGYDRVEYYKPEREQNYKKITRVIEEEVIAEQLYIEKVGGRRILDIVNHLIQTQENALEVGTNYKDRFKIIKSLMGIEFPTPAPFQREDTLDIGFGRIRFKENGKGVVNFMPDGEGLMLFRYRMVMLIRKVDMDYTISKDNVDYLATMELEEA